ncbi:MAG TPA: class I SAM-dependent methyltransferase [Solirubrobacterales bacterium]|nr:class I SAM-dependent methyltransferase [Solirubrobacterales bacterium]
MDPTEEIRDRRTHGYEGSRPDVQLLVPRSAVNVLELGCSNGALGGALKQRQPACVVGVEISDVYARTAAERLDRVVVADAEAFLDQAPPPEAPFDCLIAADLLEHLNDPWETLRRAVALLSPGATVVVSLPNVFYWQALRQALVSRRWPREDEGIFDRTHLRWFGPADARDLLSEAGLGAIEVHPAYWTDGWRLSVVKALARTPVADFLPAQLLVTGTAAA